MTTPPRILPPHYFGMAVVLIVTAAVALDSPLLPSVWSEAWRLVGGVVLLLGLGVAFRGSAQFAAADTNIIPLTQSTALVTDGVFSISRKLCVLLDSAISLLVPLVFFLVVRERFVKPEEALLEATFGDLYLNDKQRTRRWL